MPDVSAPISAIRGFNRFYTRLIGVLDESVFQSPYSLGEARIIYEIGIGAPTSAKQLGAQLGMDAGQLSRIIKRLTTRGIVLSSPNRTDKRMADLSLSDKGQEIFTGFEAISNEAVGALVAPLSSPARDELVQHMRAIERLLGRAERDTQVTLRPHRVGELGWLIHTQALIYNRTYGWNGEFEALISKIYADFATDSANQPKELWIAECDGQVAGSVFITPSGGEKSLAQLRMLYVEPWARGRGIGAKLVDQAVRYSRDNGYSGITLWTQDCLTSARRIYQSAGFKLVQEGKHHSFGKDLNGQYWQLDFAPDQ